MNEAYKEDEWKLIYAAYCVKVYHLSASVAMMNAAECWEEYGDEDPEFAAEVDCEA